MENVPGIQSLLEQTLKQVDKIEIKMDMSLLLSTLTLLTNIGHLFAESTNLTQIINSLNENLNIEWNLIVTKPEITPDIEQVLRTTNKSILIVTKLMWAEQETDMAMDQIPGGKFLYETFSQNILTIVDVDHNAKMMGSTQQNDEKLGNEDNDNILHNFKNMANLTKHCLRKLHFTNILWIIQTATTNDLHTFSQICWNFGFTKVIFFNNNSLHVYDKFPFLEVRKLSSLDHYYARKDTINFHQYPLKLPITSSPPRCYRFTDRQGHLIYSGYMYQMLMIFMQYFNFTFSEYPHDYDDDDKQPMLKALAAGEMDFTAFLTYPNHSFDASDVMWNGNFYVLVPNAKPIPKYQYFQRPFDNLVWLLNCLVFVMASLNIAGFLYVKYNGWDFSRSFIYVLSLSIYQHHLPISVRSWRFNMLYMMLIVYNFIMINYYLCMLSSLLVTTVYERQINSFEGLATTDLRLMVTQANMDYYAQMPSVSPVVVRLSIVADGIVLDELRRNLSTTTLHGAFEDKLWFFIYQQRYLKVPRLHIIDEVLYSAPIYFSIRHNLPYIKLFNRYLRNLWASGMLWKIIVNMEWFGILSGQIQYLRDEESDERLLTLEYFYSPLGLYCGGVIVSILVFVVEILYFKYMTFIVT